MEQYSYKAFISYRHQSPDQDIARKLHTQIETYAIPGALKKSLGISRMGRVFRDQDELPLSVDLGDDIHHALENSEWLICVCSPRYLQSRWCMEELDYFISLGRRDRILTILAEGEPADSFPEQLRFREEDGRRVEVEPLAADVRGATVEESLKKLKEEKLRILAPMLGVNFDDLKQRARQRRTRIAAGVLAAAVALLSGFLGYAVVKNRQITAERNAALLSQSKFLASGAQDLLDSGGDRMLATLLAREALPDDFDDPDRPVAEEAVAALRSALISGVSSNYLPLTDLNFPIKSFRANSVTLAVCSESLPGYTACFRLENGEEKDYPLKFDRAPFQVVIGNDLTRIVYTDSTGVGMLRMSGDTVTNSLLYPNTYFKWWDDGLIAERDISEFAWYYSYNIYTWSREIDTEKNSLSDLVRFPADGLANTESVDRYSDLVLTNIIGPGSSSVIMVRTNAYAESFEERIIHSYSTEIPGSDGEIIYDSTQSRDFVSDYIGSFDSRYVVGLSDAWIFIWDSVSEEQLARISCKELDGSYFESMIASPTEDKIAVTTEQDKLYIIDLAQQKAEAVSTQWNSVDTMHYSADGNTLLCCDSEEDTVLVISYGDIRQTIKADFDIEEACYVNYDEWGNSLDDSYILLKGPEKSRLMRQDKSSESAMAQTLSNGIMGASKAVLTKDGKKLWYYRSENQEYYLTVMDTRTGENTVAETISRMNVLYANKMSRVGDRFIVRFGQAHDNGKSVIFVYDAETGEKLKTINPEARGKDGDGKEITDDSSELVTVWTDDDFTVFGGRWVFYVFDSRTMELLHSELVQDSWWTNDFERQGKYIIIHGVQNDAQYVLVIDTETWTSAGSGHQWWKSYGGTVTDANLPGWGDQLSVYIYSNKTHILDLRSGENLELDILGVTRTLLNADGSAMLLYSTDGGGAWYSFDGETLAPYEPAEGEIPAEDKAEFFFGRDGAYMEDGAVCRAVDGFCLLDLHDRELFVQDAAADGSRLLIGRTGDGTVLYLLRCMEGNELLELADRAIGGRTLSTEQRKRYFLE